MMGTVRRRSNGSGTFYEARWYGAHGKQHSKSFTVKKLAERHVRDEETQRDTAKKKRRAEGDVTPTFDVLAEKWYTLTKDRPSKPAKRTTLAGYRSILDTHLLPAFGSMKIQDVDAEAIEEFMAMKGRSPTTVGNILRVLNPILRRAARDGYIAANPLPTIDGRPRAERQDPTTLAFLTPAQVLELAEEVGPRYRALIRVAVFTGARYGELAALRVRDFDPLHAKLSLRESVSEIGGHFDYGKPKNGRGRTYVLNEKLASTLAAEVEGRTPNAFIFGSDAQPLRHSNFYGRVFRPAVRRLVKDGRWPDKLEGLRFHDLRHTCASILIRDGANMKEVQGWLGHSSYQITADRYAHLYEGHQDDIVARMSKTFDEAEADLANSTVVPIG